MKRYIVPLFVLVGALPAIGQNFSFTGQGGVIVDSNVTIFSLQMKGDIVIESLRLEITNLTHDSPDDLDIFLLDPFGGSILVMSDRGNSGGITNVDLTFIDDASGVLDNVAAVVSGSYKPDGLATGVDSGLATFEGQPGCCNAWLLIVTDDTSNGNAGQFDSFTLSGGFPDGPVVPTASVWSLITMTLLTLSAGTLILRRRPVSPVAG